MLFQKQKIKGLILIKPEPFVDKRGLFRRTYCLVELKKNKIKVIDPESFQLIDKLLYTEKFYMSQINLMANLGIYYNDL